MSQSIRATELYRMPQRKAWRVRVVSTDAAGHETLHEVDITDAAVAAEGMNADAARDCARWLAVDAITAKLRGTP